MKNNTNTITINPWARGAEFWEAKNRGDNYSSDLSCFTSGALVLSVLNGNVNVSDEVIRELYNMNTLVSYIDANGNPSLSNVSEHEGILSDSRFIEHELETVVYHVISWEGCEHPLFLAYGGSKDDGICNSVITAESAKLPVYYIDNGEIILELVEVESIDGVLYPTRVFSDLQPKRAYDPGNHGEPFVEYDGVGCKFTQKYNDKFFPEEYEEVETSKVVGVVKENSSGEKYRVMDGSVLFPGDEEYRHWCWNEGTREECIKAGMESLGWVCNSVDLNHKILRNLRDNKSITISYINEEGHGEIREIDDYPEIKKLLKKVEREFNVVVYHCIDWYDSDFPVFMGYSTGYSVTVRKGDHNRKYVNRIMVQAFCYDGEDYHYGCCPIHAKDGALFLPDIFPDFYPVVKPTPKNEDRVPGRYPFSEDLNSEYFHSVPNKPFVFTEKFYKEY